MPIDLTKEYLTPRECTMLIGRVSLSRSEAVSIPRQLANIFEIAETRCTPTGTFSFKRGDETLQIQYSHQIGGARSALIHRESLNKLVPALGQIDAQTPSAKIESPVKHINAPAFKRKEELGDEWLTYHDLQAQVRKETQRLGIRQTLKAPVNLCVSQLSESFQGEQGSVQGIRCHKYKNYHGTTVAVHKDDIAQFITMLQKISHANAIKREDAINGAGITR